MQYMSKNTAETPIQEIVELLDTASFSLETVRMALAIGRRAQAHSLTLDDRLRGADHEEKEAGLVAVEALKNAASAFADLADIFDEPEFHCTGFEVRFWSTYEWLSTRLFSESAHSTTNQVLRQELVEGYRRTTRLYESVSVLERTDVILH